MLKYVVVTPANRNTQAYFHHVLESMLRQTHLPEQWIIVNDDLNLETTDNLQFQALQYSWIKLVNRQDSTVVVGGPDEVGTFWAGCEHIEVYDYDVLVKLDANVALPDDYFEVIAQHFGNNRKLGIAGGVCIYDMDTPQSEKTKASGQQVSGAFKAYRLPCFKLIDGLKPCLVWEVVDELLANYYGCEILAEEKLLVKIYGNFNQTTASKQNSLKTGQAFYYLRYGWLLAFLTSLKRSFKTKPYFISGFYALLGYFTAWQNKESQIVTQEEGAFIRENRYNAILGKTPTKQAIAQPVEQHTTQ